ncbi:MAG: hypothetical protein IPI60_17085 [Saprospiraceae bacterium]|nr:hypothetical protein [Saprospiraceae bacterium]
MKNTFILSIFIPAILLCGCYKSYDTIKVIGWVPMYSDSIDLDIKIESPRAISSLERIYVFQQYIFAIEKAKGVHIIDNSNPETPVPIHFLSIVGTTEVAIKDHYLYTDQFSELVVIDIHNIAEAMELSRKEGVFPNSGNLPDQNSGYFQCPDPGKTVEGWVRDSMLIPDCSI